MHSDLLVIAELLDKVYYVLISSHMQKCLLSIQQLPGCAYLSTLCKGYNMSEAGVL